MVGDLGGGPGYVARYLHERDVEVQGIDLSPEMIGVASRLNPGFGFRVGDVVARAV